MPMLFPVNLGGSLGGGGGGGGGTPIVFPIIAASTFQFTENSTSMPIPMPVGLTAGDGILVIASVDGNLTAPPVGYSNILTETYAITGGGPDASVSVFWKVADGTEVATTAPATAGADATVYTALIRQYQDAPVAILGTAVSTTTPNPPELVSGFGAVKTMWLAAAGYYAETSFISYPAEYPDNRFVNAPATNESLALATRELEAASADPSAFTFQFARERFPLTLAIKGAS